VCNNGQNKLSLNKNIIKFIYIVIVYQKEPHGCQFDGSYAITLLTLKQQCIPSKLTAVRFFLIDYSKQLVSAITIRDRISRHIAFFMRISQ
jgi:hypothetical protein